MLVPTYLIMLLIEFNLPANKNIVSNKIKKYTLFPSIPSQVWIWNYLHGAFKISARLAFKINRVFIFEEKI